MKPNSSLPRRTALAVAAASAGLTLAITATIAGGLGLMAPAAPVSSPSAGQEQPMQSPPALVTSDGLASIPIESAGQRAATIAVVSSTGSTDARLARRDHEADDDDERAEKVRRTSPTGASAERLARLPVSRNRGGDDRD
jgi:hypothetical protein